MTTRPCELCTNTAKFRVIGKKFASRCLNHIDTAYEFSGNICEHPTCNKRASFGPTDGRKQRCSDHRKTDEVLIGKPTCPCGSGKKPIFGPEGDTKPTQCGSCKSPESVDLKNKKCKNCNRKQVATFLAFEDPSVMTVCIACARADGNEGATNLRMPSCKTCGKLAIFGERGKRKRDAEFCGKCRDPDVHVDLHHRMCPVCTVVRGQKHMRDHCLRCFIHTFPDEPVARNYKTKEKAVDDFLLARFPDLTLTFDRRLERVSTEHVGAGAGAGAAAEDEGACRSSGRRPDVFIDMGSWVVIVEIDENQHDFDSYDDSCERKRIMQIFDDAGRRPMVVVRFNPDDYIDATGIRVASPWRIDGRSVSPTLHVPSEYADAWQHRLERLGEAVASATHEHPPRELTFVHLFFDH